MNILKTALTKILLFVLLFTTLSIQSASANNDSPLTLGVGGGVGIHKSANFNELSGTAFVNQANVRLKFLWIFGFDYSYDLSRDISLVQPIEGDLNYKSKMRATALLYPYNGEYVSFYLGGGIGGAKLVDLSKIDSPTNSYHAGLGFEFHLAKHFSIDTSFMVLAPGAHSIVDNTVARIDAAIAKDGVGSIRYIEPPSLGDFLSIKNHEFMIRIFLFL